MTNKLLSLVLLMCAPAASYAFDIINSQNTVLCVDSTEDVAVKSAAAMVREDFHTVSGRTMEMGCLKQQTAANAALPVIVAGTVGNAAFDRWLSASGIATDDVKGKWEAFCLTVKNVGNRNVLVVMGSDKRGTAYGLMEISRLMGVSPWQWWADVTPEHKDRVTISDTYHCVQEPSVQFRGIFLNDEENFTKWSKVTFEKSTNTKNTVGPQTYEKVFRLLLRLRANCIWPAMHSCSTPFFTVPGNKEMAHKYGITMATSHCEPMMRAALEWNEKKMGALNYVTNHDKIVSYWEERVKSVADGDNIYTVGMRGLHDLPMQGATTTEGKIGIVERAFADQREMLKKYVNKDVTQVPQVFVPYKEVLGLYNNGLKVPDDVTLMWCNDNFGYLTRLSNAQEQKRKGGAGVYYHISYWGRPNGYLTLCTQSPALIYEQMRRAYDANARKIWIVNVGDLKPGEFDTEFFLNMAWDINSVTTTNIPDIITRWYSDIFGNSVGQRAAAVMKEYYRLAMERKPEHAAWNRVEEAGYKKGIIPVSDGEFNPFENGDEVLRRMEAYDRLEAEVRSMAKDVPARLSNAYTELVLTPVLMAKNMNSKWLAAKKNHLYAKHALPAANDYAHLSEQYTKDAQTACAEYGKLLDGKWNNILKLNGWNRENALPRKDTVKVDGANKQTVFWCEHDSVPMAIAKKIKVTMPGQSMYVQLFTMNGSKPVVEITKKPKWLNASVQSAYSASEARLNLSMADDYQAKEKPKAATLTLKVNGRKYQLEVTPIAEDFYPIDLTHTADGNATSHIAGLGYSTKAQPLETGKTYTFDVQTERAGKATLRVGMLPLQPLTGGDLRYSVSIDGQPAQTVSIKTDAVERDEAWKVNVMRNQSITLTTWNVQKPGRHTITIKPLDNGIVLDQMQLDFKPARQFYSLP